MRLSTRTYILKIDCWHPARLNQWDGFHWSKGSRLKKAVRELVTAYALRAGIPRAIWKRRVSLKIILSPKQRAGDPDAYWKSLLDALVHAALLLDDNRQGVELGQVTFSRGERATEIMLEDLG
jgi:Holliday junction resolvase RusA-like endonuclease